MALNEPGNRRLDLHLTLLGTALESMSLGPAKPIRPPHARQEVQNSKRAERYLRAGLGPFGRSMCLVSLPEGAGPSRRELELAEGIIFSNSLRRISGPSSSVRQEISFSGRLGRLLGIVRRSWALRFARQVGPV